MAQQEMFSIADEKEVPIVVTLRGNTYWIIYEASRPPRPSWYVQRKSDLRVSKRFYSWPDGAFAAIMWGRCQWVD